MMWTILVKFGIDDRAWQDVLEKFRKINIQILFLIRSLVNYPHLLLVPFR
jgi:hypothetical protein